MMIFQPLVGLSLLLAPLAPVSGASGTALSPWRAPERAAVAPITGLYVATRLNYAPLPRIERVPSQDGWEHWFRLMEGNITIRPDGRFIASFKYFRQHVRPRAAVKPGPMLNETYKGKYTVRGSEITFIPDKTKKGRVKPIVGTINASGLTVPYIVAEGQSKHPLRLDMKRESSW
jgi:hypothetical protein